MAVFNLGANEEFFGAISLRRTRLIKIQPVTGNPLYLTTSATSIEYEGDTYVPVLAVDMSAQSESIGGEEYDSQITGAIDNAISSPLLTNADLSRGVYRGARVTEYLVDPKYPYAGALKTYGYVIESVSWNGEFFDAQIGGLLPSVGRRNGQTYSRQCVVELGGPYCGVNLEDFRFPQGNSGAAVGSVLNLRSFTALGFQTGAITEDYFTFGTVQFLTGENRGRFATILNYEPNGDVFLLAEPLPFDVATGDKFFAFAGCQKTQSACKDKFNNYRNFQGNPYVRGTSTSIDAPASS